MQMPSVNSLQKILKSAEWGELTQRLLDYVENFQLKIVQARSGFQM